MAKPVQLGTAPSLSASPSPTTPAAASAAAVQRVVESFNFRREKAQADLWLTATQQNLSWDAKKKYDEILEKAKLPGCPTEFALGSVFYVKCLIGKVKAYHLVKDHQNMVDATKDALGEIKRILERTQDVVIVAQLYQNLEELRKYTEEAGELAIICDDNYGGLGLDPQQFSKLCDELIQKCNDKINPPTVPAKQVTSEDPIGGSNRWVNFLAVFVVGFGVAGLCYAFYHRNVIWINPSSK